MKANNSCYTTVLTIFTQRQYIPINNGDVTNIENLFKDNDGDVTNMEKQKDFHKHPPVVPTLST